MPFAKSIKITLLVVAGFVAVAALTLLLRQRRSVGGGMSHATAYDFGEVVQGQPVEHEFAWRNTERTALAVDTVITAYASTLLAADSLVPAGGRSEERRVGKECRSRWWRERSKKQQKEERERKG